MSQNKFGNTAGSMMRNGEDFGKTGFNQSQASFATNPASLKGKLMSLEVLLKCFHFLWNDIFVGVFLFLSRSYLKQLNL